MGGFSCDRVAATDSIAVAITTYVANLTNHTIIDICELLFTHVSKIEETDHS